MRNRYIMKPVGGDGNESMIDRICHEMMNDRTYGMMGYTLVGISLMDKKRNL